MADAIPMALDLNDKLEGVSEGVRVNPENKKYAWWSKQWDEAERLHKAFLGKYPKSPFCETVLNSRLPAIAKKSL